MSHRLELTVAWVGVGLLCLLSFPDAFGSTVGWILLAPWLAGLAILLGPSAARASETLRRAGRRKSVRLACLTLVVLLAASAVVVTPSAAVLALLYLGAIWLVASQVWSPRSIAILTVNATLVATALAAGIVAAELALRHPTLARQWGSPQERAAWQEKYDGIWRRNVLGFRSPYENVTPPEGTIRILALGDSFTWGDKIASADSTWPAVLERELDRRGPGRDVQVVNAGRRGFTTANEAELLRRLGWKLEPDLVLVQYFVNDVFPSEPNFGRLGSEAVFGRVRLLPARFRSGPAGSSALLAFLESRLNGLLGPEPGQRYTSLYQGGREGWEQMQAALRDMGSAGAGREVPVLFFVVPALVPGEWSADGHPHRSIYDQVLTTADAAGLRTLDLSPAFAAADRDARTWWATPYDSHPGREAHRKIGLRVAEEVMSEGLVTGQE